MPRMKMKKLETFLQGVEGFDKPKLVLEQYPTPAHIASCMIFNIQTYFGAIENKLVADLGCGSGVLGIGSFLMGADMTIGFELDSDAIDVFRRNVTDMEIPGIECVQLDVVKNIDFEKWSNVFDTVVMNPPFGTKNNAGIDMKFLESAVKLSNKYVFSLHKTSTRDHIKKTVKEWGVESEVIAELVYNIDALYKFHKKPSVDVEVDFWMFNCSNKTI